MRTIFKNHLNSTRVTPSDLEEFKLRAFKQKEAKGDAFRDDIALFYRFLFFFTASEKPIFLFTPELGKDLQKANVISACHYLRDTLKDEKFSIWFECKSWNFALNIGKSADTLIIAEYKKDEQQVPISKLPLDSLTSEEKIAEFLKVITEHNAYRISLALNCLTYLLSGEPDTREPIEPASNDIPRRQRDKINQQNDLPDFPAIRVGTTWLKDRARHVESTNVIGHFRWQPYGEQNSKLKLIWIDSHLRTYRNTLK